MVTDAELSLEFYLNEHRSRGVLRGKNEFDGYFHRQSEYWHAANVTQAVLELHKDAVELAKSFYGSEIEVQLCFGLGRRAKFIWRSLCELLQHAHPLRKEPLTYDDAEWVAMRLNEIYINIRGRLDNLAWALVDIFECGSDARIRPVTVSIFHSKFAVHQKCREIALLANDFKEWNRDFSSRRDPAAHRIPLVIPNAIHNPESLDRANEILAETNALWLTASQERNDLASLDHSLDRIGRGLSAIEELGEFKPVFVHHPEEQGERIFPTVPNDAATLVKIANRVFGIIKMSQGTGTQSKRVQP